MVLMEDFQRHVGHCFAVGIEGGWVSGAWFLSHLEGLALLSFSATVTSAFSTMIV